MAYDTDDARWTAVVTRDQDADGEFLFAVTTTGVYCRPGCSGRPLRRNVRFYDTARAARADGFRACKRCRPDEARETLRWTTVATDLGAALVAASDAGLRAITLGDDAAALRADLSARFPKARLVQDAGGLGDLAAKVRALIADPTAGAELPLDDRGTELQRAVWKALRAIPPGRTASYAEVARAIGRPEAVRAVAQACGANPLAVLTPCHRVVRSDGGLSGYRWGVERKRALLVREGAAA
ncbi:methylated-DNA--[protein]-cysteine S-methyltransferase [Caulobacter mirabilis]|uniref:methylated-DNA--[protein]-cysteine S-methyltransferase n=1 Tax=Caulobacter mirabilis TaxID=69666 RepID=A0A2D2B261_9CAUL|nr:methylated-DNA--[protein]-cysteine S-methyltransferase [Caulobacter mirabilis]ATQ44308.1 transcriptional regulator [Caulobacter mirabilis]